MSRSILDISSVTIKVGVAFMAADFHQDVEGLSRNTRRRILPMLVFGSGCVRNSTIFGTL
jgi:hypothetical protein